MPTLNWELVLEARVDGPVVPKGRPRCSCVGGRPRLYTPSKTRSWEQGAARVFAAAKNPVHGNLERYRVVATFFRALPGKGANPGGLCQAGADLDNLGKAVLDSLQTAGVMRDDRMVVELSLCKRWASEDHPEGVEVIVFGA